MSEPIPTPLTYVILPIFVFGLNTILGLLGWTNLDPLIVKFADVVQTDDRIKPLVHMQTGEAEL